MGGGEEKAPLLGRQVSEKKVRIEEIESNLTFRDSSSSADNEQPASQTELFVTMLPFIILQVLFLLLLPFFPSSSDQHWALCLPPSHLLPLGGSQERSQPRPVWRRLWDHPPQPLHLWTPGWEVPPSLGRSCHLFCRISH